MVLSRFEANPYLHVEERSVYNPLTNLTLLPGESAYELFRAFERTGNANEALRSGGWVIESGEDLSRQYLLKIVSLETMTACNQKCYFCPVSIAPREDESMPPELFDSIVNQLTTFRRTLEGVFLQSYNEPTIDRRFVDFCGRLFEAGLPVAVLSNGSGLTQTKVDALLERGRLRYLCINLSTLDRHRYASDRGEDHLPVVLKNLDYFKSLPVADQMRIVVLGEGDETHRGDFEAIRERFAGSRFEVEMHHAQDRAGWLEVGMKAMEKKRNLAGCDLIGSRPLQHLHITPKGTCILCCQDYDERYVIGDLRESSIVDVLESDEMAKLRRWAYGVEEAPDDFICRTCVWARER